MARLRLPRVSGLRLPKPPGLDLLRARLPAPLRRRLGIALRRGLTVGTITDRLAEVYGRRAAFVLPERSRLAGKKDLSFVDVHRAVGKLAGALRRAGVGAGDLVAVVPSNGCDFLLSFLAVVRAGGVAVPVNPILKPPEARTLVELSGARTVLCDARTLRSTIGARARLPSVTRWLSLGPARGATDVRASSRRVARIPPRVRVAPDTVVAVLYTSGTTGRPKGARLTDAGVLSMLSRAALHPTGLPGSVRLAVTALPVAHVMGLATSLGLLLAGIPNRMFPRFDARHVLDAIERERAELFVGVPAMYRAMLDAGAERRDLTSVKAWASAADVMPRDLARRFQSFGRLIGPVPALFVEAYGMVELAGAAVAKVIPPGPDLLPKRLAGMPLYPYRAKVVDGRGRELPRGRVGELAVKGPGVLEGYHGDPDATGRVLAGGWLRTGDLARIGPFGAIYLEGRKKEVVKVGGYSVFPVEVEEEIRRHPKVADAAVVGIPDRARGEVPAAAVAPRRGVRLTAAEMERWASTAIASYRRPRRWIVLAELPRGATRKADKRAIRAMLVGRAPAARRSSRPSAARPPRPRRETH